MRERNNHKQLVASASGYIYFAAARERTHHHLLDSALLLLQLPLRLGDSSELYVRAYNIPTEFQTDGRANMRRMPAYELAKCENARVCREN